MNHPQLPSPDPNNQQLAPRNPRGHQQPYVDAPYYASDPADDQETGGLIEYWRILSRRKGTLILIAFAGALAGFLFTLPQTPVYQARTSIEIVELNDNFLNIKQISPVNENGGYYDPADLQTQIKILQSDSLLDRVLNKLKSDKEPAHIEQTRISTWRRALGLPQAPKASNRDQALRQAAGTLKVRAAGQSRILEITVDSVDPNIAASFANTLSNEFMEQNLKLKQVQQELSIVQNERIAKQSRYEMAMNSSPDALPDVLNDLGLRDTQVKITDLHRQIAELSTIYTPEHSRVKRLQNQLATLQTAYERDRTAILKRIKNEYDEALRKEKLLAGAYSAQTRQVSGESEKAIQYNMLKRDVDSSRTLYDTMLQQLKQATIAAAMRASNIRVVDPAAVPARPYKPRAPVSAGLGLLTGLFLGAAFIVMRERADRSIQQPGDSTFFLNLPELGIIPSALADPSVRRTARTLRAASRLVSTPGSSVISTSSLEDRVELVTWQRKPSMLAESFRSALISILFAGENGSRPKVLVLTSSGPGEGKSTVVSNLGIAIAEVGQKVLLIDADMRKPRMHEIFGMTNERGLSEILRQKMTLNGDPSMQGLIRETEVPGLFVLTSGTSTSAATNLLYGNYMPELLKYLRVEFETILIDTPPMLQIPDARVLGRIADKVILVVRAGKTTRDAAVAARQRFSEDGTKLLGTILNDWNPKHSTTGYYGYYNGYYGKPARQTEP